MAAASLRSSGPDEASKFANKKYPCILALATDAPDLVVPQEHTADWMASVASIQTTKSKVADIYKNSKINTRHLANPDFSLPFNPENFQFFPKNDSLTPAPSIEYRMQKYKEYAWTMVDRTVKRLFDDCPNLDPSEIGKIIMVSNTGFVAPGFDVSIIKKYKLPLTTERANLCFMGCAAGVNGLHTATDYIQSNPHKKVLLLCVEVSSVHSAFEDDINSVITHAIFADGCAGVILGMNTVSEAAGKMLVVDKMSMIIPDSEDGILLDIKNTGITCTLSKVLRTYLESHLEQFINQLLSKAGESRSTLDFWGAHPGGTRILQAVQNSLKLTEEDLAESWHILSQYGNMLSTSVFFVLQQHLQKYKQKATENNDKPPNKVYDVGVTFSFSPGVGIEGSVLYYVH